MRINESKSKQPPPNSNIHQQLRTQNHYQHRKKTIIYEPEPQTSNTRLAQILADPIPPLIIAVDVENASGTWLGEIWQICAACNCAAAAAAVDDSRLFKQESFSSSAAAAFLVNLMPVGTIHWGPQSHIDPPMPMLKFSWTNRWEPTSWRACTLMDTANRTRDIECHIWEHSSKNALEASRYYWAGRVGDSNSL
jgi:hypothetical protein